MNFIFILCAVSMVIGIAASYAMLVVHVALAETLMLSYSLQVNSFFIVAGLILVLVASHCIKNARFTRLISKPRNILWIALLAAMPIMLMLLMLNSFNQVSASHDVEVVGHWQHLDRHTQCFNSECSACVVHPLLRDVETREIFKVEMPHDLKGREKFYPHQLCTSQANNTSISSDESQADMSFKVARVTWNETLMGRRTVLTVVDAKAVDKAAEQNELPRPKVLAKTYTDILVEKFLALGLNTREIIAVFLMCLGGLLMVVCPFLKLGRVALAGLAMLLFGIILYSILGAILVLGIGGPMGYFVAKAHFYKKNYPIFDYAPVRSVPYGKSKKLTHDLYITPLRSAFFIGIKYWFEADGSNMSRTTFWKDSFATYEEAEVELTRRYEAWQASGRFSPD
jgi:hypothetical protein